jgi:RHS repeat-associated protein
LCQQRDGADTVQARFYPEGEYWSSGSVQLVYMPDQLGSVRDLVNVSGPSVVYSEDFTPYGNAASTSGSTVPVFGFAGLVFDGNSSLNYSTSRFYDPASGRWLSRDPIAETVGIDLFAYTGGNPVGYMDPHGTTCGPFCTVIGKWLWPLAVAENIYLQLKWDQRPLFSEVPRLPQHVVPKPPTTCTTDNPFGYPKNPDFWYTDPSSGGGTGYTPTTEPDIDDNGWLEPKESETLPMRQLPGPPPPPQAPFGGFGVPR